MLLVLGLITDALADSLKNILCLIPIDMAKNGGIIALITA